MHSHGWRRALWFGMSAGLFSASVATSRADAIDDLVTAAMKRERIPGAAVVALREGRVAKLATYGAADVDRGIAVSNDTPFRLQSASKPFVATAVMLLVEGGKLSLDDPISRHLPETPAAWQRITVRHLLTHTSGLPDFINEATVDLARARNNEELTRSLANRALKFEPGAAWEYSNSNYHLLAALIEHVTGLWYGEFLAERIFKPLGMTDTAVVRDVDTLARNRGYAAVRGRIEAGTLLAPVVASYGGGGICSTITDMAKWAAMLDTQPLVKPTSLDLMATPVRLNNGTTHGYGFGWELGDVAGHRRMSHRGDWIGYAAAMDRWVDDRVTVVVLANLSGANVGRLAQAVAATLVPAVAERIYRPIADREPAVTARLADVLRRAGAGTLKADEFVEPVWKYLEGNAAQLRRDFGKLGELQKLTLVERTEGPDDGRSYRYEARFTRTTLRFHFIITRGDRIAAMTPEL